MRYLLLIIFLIALSGCGGTAPPPLPTIPLTIAGQTLRVEVAATISARQRGLMGRAELSENSGMLFVYGADRTGLSFWMKDTSIPLSVAFLDAAGRVINMHDMRPLDATTQYAAAGPARFALEVPQGWFVRHGMRVGDQADFTLPADLPIDP